MSKTVFLGIAVAACSLIAGPAWGDVAPAKRVPWTTSRITGSPEPPLPFRVERFAPQLGFNNATFIEFAPAGDRVFIGEQNGKIYSFDRKQPGAKPDLALDAKQEIKSWKESDGVKDLGAVYDLCFDPAFAENRWIYFTYTLLSKTDKPLPNGTRVSRFRVTNDDPPRIDPASEKLVIAFLEGGHNGGCLAFGRDGHLYVSSGDAASPNPPDILATGQDCSDLLSSILRLDIKTTANDPNRGYVVPPDNPFVHLSAESVRPEIWAFGFRNPWKMSFDRGTGDLWVGDVGWELWELVDRVEKGGNYGWSLMEGRQPVRKDVKLGPSPVLPPTLEFPHTEAASITGGFVYRGTQFPELVGSYICGDWETRNIWAAKREDGRIVEKQRIASDTLRIVDFGEDPDGELYILDYGDKAGLYKLVRNEGEADSATKFPRRLSETGLFSDVVKHELAPGVYPFEVNVEQWIDGATSQRFIALPGEGTVKIHDKSQWIPGSMFSGKIFFPKDGVLGRTLSFDRCRLSANPSPDQEPQTRRLETQILHYDGKAWRGYTYRWNDEQTDAELVDSSGRDESFTYLKFAEVGEVKSGAPPAQEKSLHWHYASRTECLQCHNPWSGYALAFNLPQLHRPAVASVSPSGEDQVEVFKRLGVLDAPEEKSPLAFPQTFAAASIDAKARAYLHVNCAHCHQMGAGGSVDLDLRAEMTLDKMKVVDVKPAQGSFGIADARIVASGRPFHSVLYYRMSKFGRGRMPHIGSEVVDVAGLRLVRDWIRSLAPEKTDDGLAAWNHYQAALASRNRARSGQDGAEADRTENEFRAAYDALFADPSAALATASKVDDGAWGLREVSLIDQKLTSLPESPARDVLERFRTETRTSQRLGASSDVAQLLRLRGEPSKGKTIFHELEGVTCKNCHKVAGNASKAAGEVGPDLSGVGKKLTREQLLESLTNPSKSIDPKFAGYAIETTDGRSIVGRLVERTPDKIVLRDAQGKEIVVLQADVETFVPLALSLMPERLLQDFTAQEAADLLSYLESLKDAP